MGASFIVTSFRAETVMLGFFTQHHLLQALNMLSFLPIVIPFFQISSVSGRVNPL